MLFNRRDLENKKLYTRFCKRGHDQNINNTIVFLDERAERCLKCKQIEAERLFNRTKQDKNIQFDIILPTINRPSLKESIKSVLDQSYQKWILYVIGDGVDPDNSIKDDRIVYLRTVNNYNDSGATPRNIGISISFSYYIAYNDCDDLLKPHAIQTVVDMISSNPQANIFKTSGTPFYMKHKHPRSSQKIMKMGQPNHNDIMTVGLSHSREIFEKTEGWKNIPEMHDRVLFNEMIAAGGIPIISQEVTFLYRR